MRSICSLISRLHTSLPWPRSLFAVNDQLSICIMSFVPLFFGFAPWIINKIGFQTDTEKTWGPLRETINPTIAYPARQLWLCCTSLVNPILTPRELPFMKFHERIYRLIRATVVTFKINSLASFSSYLSGWVCSDTHFDCVVQGLYISLITLIKVSTSDVETCKKYKHYLPLINVKSKIHLLIWCLFVRSGMQWYTIRIFSFTFIPISQILFFSNSDNELKDFFSSLVVRHKKSFYRYDPEAKWPPPFSINTGIGNIKLRAAFPLLSLAKMNP